MTRSLFRFCVCAFLFSLSVDSLSGQARPDFGRTTREVDSLSEKEADEFLNSFLQTRGGLDSVLDGRLIYYPRRGEKSILPIRIYTGWRGSELDLRIEGDPDGFAPSQRFLFRGGENPAGWEWDLEQGLKRLPRDQIFEPLIEGMDLTAFDLLTPYLDWPDANYDESERVLDSPAHWFRFSPPEDWQNLLPSDGLETVRVALDARFDAPIRVEYLNEDGDVIRALEARSFKKISDTWIVRRLEAINERTRDRTEWRIDDAAVELTLPAATFSPEVLGDPVTGIDEVFN